MKYEEQEHVGLNPPSDRYNPTLESSTQALQYSLIVLHGFCRRLYVKEYA